MGGDPGGTPELKDVYPKYRTVFDLFDVCVDVRYGNFLFLPSAWGALEQPAKTMDCLRYARSLLRQKIAEEEKKRLNARRR